MLRFWACTTSFLVVHVCSYDVLETQHAWLDSPVCMLPKDMHRHSATRNGQPGAQDRAYRIRQQRNVTVYRLIAMGTLEELIYMRQLCASPRTMLMAADRACLADFRCGGCVCSRQHCCRHPHCPRRQGLLLEPVAILEHLSIKVQLMPSLYMLPVARLYFCYCAVARYKQQQTNVVVEGADESRYFQGVQVTLLLIRNN